MNVAIVLGLVRHILTIAGGFLVSSGTLDQPDVETGVGAILTISGIAWSIFDKKRR